MAAEHIKPVDCPERANPNAHAQDKLAKGARRSVNKPDQGRKQAGSGNEYEQYEQAGQKQPRNESRFFFLFLFH